MYEFGCDVCGKKVDVLRHHDNQTPPTIEEGGACEVDERNGVTEHKWTKRIHAPRMARGPGWGAGRKGAW